ncbi:CBS domain-containing protein [Pseudonocardia broussonetiae]|uniref:CBS domain-containing protein n=1 Tax=Pseudonocardia broussonetiae TaxID=2736640 RepID=A0A6M6JNP5_9PSEU|nr:CBS domain-containing protein [Pseudonocardia broussonetiae]QJY48985.1 CBS domain-containing protein [Pseudonocardia broussonetiae]
MRNSTVADVMTRRPLTARPAMPLKELARVLTEHGISALPVLDRDDRVVGIVSERDLLSEQAEPSPRRARWWQRRRTRQEIRRSPGGTVGHVMTEDPVTVSPRATLAEAAGRMIEHEVKHLPVVDEHGALVGMVSRGDLVRRFVRSDDEIRADVIDDVLLHVLWIDATQVEVTVTDGIVTLAGTVDLRSTAQIAERLVHRLDGVVDVVSALTYLTDDGGLEGRPPHTPQPAATPTTDRTGITT